MKSCWAKTSWSRCQGRGSLKSLNANCSCRWGVLDQPQVTCASCVADYKVRCVNTWTQIYDFPLCLDCNTVARRPVEVCSIFRSPKSMEPAGTLDQPSALPRSGPWTAKPKPFWKLTVPWCRCRRIFWAADALEGDEMWVCLKMLCTPLYPMVLLIIIPTKWLFHWGYTPFSDIPMWWDVMRCDE